MSSENQHIGQMADNTLQVLTIAENMVKAMNDRTDAMIRDRDREIERLHERIAHLERMLHKARQSKSKKSEMIGVG